LVAQSRREFLDELDADKFEPDGENEYVCDAWWVWERFSIAAKPVLPAHGPLGYSHQTI
jgi:hypothetical protein